MVSFPSSTWERGSASSACREARQPQPQNPQPAPTSPRRRRQIKPPGHADPMRRINNKQNKQNKHPSLKNRKQGHPKMKKSKQGHPKKNKEKKQEKKRTPKFYFSGGEKSGKKGKQGHPSFIFPDCGQRELIRLNSLRFHFFGCGRAGGPRGSRRSLATPMPRWGMGDTAAAASPVGPGVTGVPTQPSQRLTTMPAKPSPADCRAFGPRRCRAGISGRIRRRPA